MSQHARISFSLSPEFGVAAVNDLCRRALGYYMEKYPGFVTASEWSSSDLTVWGQYNGQVTAKVTFVPQGSLVVDVWFPDEVGVATQTIIRGVVRSQVSAWLKNPLDGRGLGRG